jgi:hypothetical protein
MRAKVKKSCAYPSFSSYKLDVYTIKPHDKQGVSTSYIW